MDAETKLKQLQELYGDWQHCQRCGLCKPVGRHRHHVVFGEGNPDARVVIVGEAPGEQEDITGSPFSGRSGEVLDMLLDSCNSNRDEVFILNILGCRPTEDADPRQNRKPTKDEVKACLLRVHRIIEIVDPYVVIMLGTTAMKTLTEEKKNLTAVARGSMFALDVVTEGQMLELTRPGFATFHPSFLLRGGLTTEDGGDLHKTYLVFQKAFRMADMYAELYHGITPPQRRKHG